MTAAITADGRFERNGNPAMECPHCSASGPMTVAAFPAFSRLKAERPAQVGVVLQCPACQAPVFLRYRTRAWREDRVELNPLPQAVEHAPERFSLGYLPPAVATRFREALACYSSGLWQAFAAMCRQTARATFDDVGEAGRMKIFDLVAEVRDLGAIDDATFEAVRRVIFDPDTGRPEARFERREAAALLETMKDLLTQTYVRRAKLRQALKVRRFFANQAAGIDDEDESASDGPATGSALRG
ncbi:MAG: hypothetical protein DYH20_06560 [Gammaproteobacteria bacterium PRO9]|nr:hypothetical protein [Gammaproteobacteria bacterium PRO9]